MFDREQLVLIVLEFLEAVLHQLLFVRQLYSAELFERQKLYGVAVRKSRHPDLNRYLHEVVSSLKVGLLIPLMRCANGTNNQPPTRREVPDERRLTGLQVPVADGSLAKLVVVISDPARTPIERHIIQPEVGERAALRRPHAGQAAVCALPSCLTSMPVANIPLLLPPPPPAGAGF